MANLIITIISLAIFAIVAASAIYYGGQAFENAQINATANAIMNEAQQILAAERIWSTNNGQPDISGMGTAGHWGTGMSALVNGNELSEWPSFGGTLGYSTSLTNPGPQPFVSPLGSGNLANGVWDKGCYSINGYYGPFNRFMFSYNNGNYVAYIFNQNNPYVAPCSNSNGTFASTSGDLSQSNHPIIQIAKAINAATQQVPSDVLPNMLSIGIPYVANGSASETTIYDTSVSATNAARIRFDAAGILQTNYCYFYGPAGGNAAVITCVFGPS